MIYLDHNATSPARPQVIESMLPFFSEKIGNPASVHSAGRIARQGLDEARRGVAHFLDVHESQIIFTSGGTESNTMALFSEGIKSGFSGHIITSNIEHPSILQTCDALKKRGMTVTHVGVDKKGRLDPDTLFSAFKKETVLVSVMHANNEIGTIQPLSEIGAFCRQRGVVFHSDAVQSVGKIEVDFYGLNVDMLSISAHKLGGPKGIGALIVDKRYAVEPLMVGGGQERGRRSGTENLPGIIGFAKVCDTIQTTLLEESQRLKGLKHQLESQIQEALPDSVIFGQKSERLPNTSALAVPGTDGETVVMNLDLEGFAVSSGSACSSGRSQPSHVAAALGIEDGLALSMVRVTLGWNTTQEDIKRFVKTYIRVIKRLQSMAGL